MSFEKNCSYDRIAPNPRYVVFIVTGLAILLSAAPSTNAATTVDRKTVRHPPVINPYPALTAERDIKAHPLPVEYSERYSRRGEYTASSKTKSGGMKVLFLNCQSFNTAKADIECLCSRYSVDLLCLNETWEDPNHPCCFSNWSKICSKARADKHGGVAIFCNPRSDTFTVSPCNLFDQPNLEICAVKIHTNMGKTIFVLCAYVPPQKEDQLNSLATVLDTKGVDNIVLVGDLNGKSPEWGNLTTDKHGEILEGMLSKNNLIVHNDGQPTRRGKSSIIDLIISSSTLSNVVASCDTLSHEVVRSDHIAILTELSIDKKTDSDGTRNIRSFKKADWHAWKEMTDTKFSTWLNNPPKDLETAFSTFDQITNSCFEELFPIKTIKLSKRPKAPYWWNEDVRDKKKSLNHFQRRFKKRNTPQNKIALQQAEDKFNEAKERAKEAWANDLVDQFDNSRNSKEMWNSFRKLTNRSSDNSILPLINEDKVIFDRETKCATLQKAFFDEKQLETDDHDKDFQEQIDSEISELDINPNADDDRAYNAPFTLGEVEAAISKLKKGKAPGPDSYPPEIFIYAGDYMREAILVLFSLSWSEGVLPDIWKSADIKFLRKPNKSDYYTTAAYRPISLTPCLAKLMESLILTRLQSHIEGMKLIDPEQEGFRKNHSTTNAVLRLTETIADGLATAAIFVDLKGAFDRVWRNGLIHKLHQMGITGRMLRWIHNFLTSRTARCHIQDTAGPTFSTSVGLPQGSVLSPVLFNTYIIDMYEKSGGKCVKFADDGTDWEQDKDALVAVQLVCRKAVNWVKWCRKWKMSVNFNKTEGTVFSLEQDLPVFSFKIGKATICYNPTPKILGITLDEKLSFMQHLQNTEKKASRALKINQRSERNRQCFHK